MLKVWKLVFGYVEVVWGKEIGDGFIIDEYLYDGSDVLVVGNNVVLEIVVNIEGVIEY